MELDVFYAFAFILQWKKHSELALDDEKLVVIPDILTILKHVFEITNCMSKEDVPTINKVVPFTKGLLINLKGWNCQNTRI